MPTNSQIIGGLQPCRTGPDDQDAFAGVDGGFRNKSQALKQTLPGRNGRQGHGRGIFRREFFGRQGRYAVIHQVIFAVASRPGDIPGVKDCVTRLKAGDAIACFFDDAIGIPAKHSIILKTLANLCIDRIHANGNDADQEILWARLGYRLLFQNKGILVLGVTTTFCNDGFHVILQCICVCNKRIIAMSKFLMTRNIGPINHKAN